MENQEPQTLLDAIVRSVGEEYKSESFKIGFTLFYMGRAHISESEVWYNLNLTHADEKGRYAMTDMDKSALEKVDWKKMPVEEKDEVLRFLVLCKDGMDRI